MVTRNNIIDVVYRDNHDLVELLNSSGEISLAAIAADNFKKVLLLSIASFFEARVRKLVLDFVERKSQSCAEVVHFVRNKAVERQYHTYFDWKSSKNANSFFGLFGDEFKTLVGAEIERSDALKAGMKAFLQLGNSRNNLVHENFASCFVEQSVDEIYQLYEQADDFVIYLESRFGGS